jgi:ATPase family associated with various cellular activities (AAA)
MSPGDLTARLDVLLAAAVSEAERSFGAPNPYRGLFVDQVEVERALDQERRPKFFTAREPILAAGPLAFLDLDPFDLDVVALALAPELSLGYERVFGYLHDDVTRRRPSVGLACDILCETQEERLAARKHFAADAPLLRDRVIAPLDTGVPLLRAPLQLDDQIVRLLLRTGGLDRRLAETCRLTRPARSWDDVPLPVETVAGLQRLGDIGLVRVHLRGAEGLGQLEAAEAVAASADSALLIATGEADPFLVAREAFLHEAVLFAPVEGAVTGFDTPVVLHGEAVTPAGFVSVPLDTPPVDVRRGCWRNALKAAAFEAPDEAVNALADRFRLSPRQIGAAVEATRTAASWDRGRANLFAAARVQTGAELAKLADKIVTVHDWEDLVLPEGSIRELRELCDRVVHRERVLDHWGFDARLALGKGVTALFTGASGTGKTMAAGVVARALELDAYRINLAGVVSPWIGETEQNLDRIFVAAAATNAILFFDEADALFGKRSQVHDARDRYANLEISYLLQRMEAFDGVSLLATNLQRNIDDAFLRRLDFAINFPFPGVDERKRMWRAAWPDATPVADDVDYEGVAERFALSGGAIRNAALAAAYAAAADGGVVDQRHVLQGIRRELIKLGKNVGEEELGGVLA